MKALIDVCIFELYPFVCSDLRLLLGLLGQLCLLVPTASVGQAVSASAVHVKTVECFATGSALMDVK